MSIKRSVFIYSVIFTLFFQLLLPFGSVFAETNTTSISVAEAFEKESGTATVQGYIVGTSATTSSIGSGVFEGDFTIRTNVLIADQPNERDLNKIMAVQLPNNAIRTAVNLVDNPNNLGQKVAFTGTLGSYFGKTGVRDVKEFSFNVNVEPIIEDEIGTNYLSVRQAIDNNNGIGTVEGYIVGTRNVFDGPFTTNSNIQLADHPDEKGLVHTLPVQLPAGAIRNALNLVDNPHLLGRKVRITGSLEAYFSSPGLKSPSLFELVSVEDMPVLEIPTVTIAEARTMLGQTIVTEGIVNVDNQLLQRNRLSVYIQDVEAGIQLFNFNAGQFPHLEAGDRVRVKGQVGEHNNVSQIIVEDLEVLETNIEIAPKHVSLVDYLDLTKAEALEGQLVTFEAFVFNIPAYSGGGSNITVIDEDLNVLTVRAWESTGLDLSKIKQNSWYEITAISSQFRTTYQVLPRSNEDFKALEVQREKPFYAGVEVRSTVERVVDGDTIRLSTPVFGATNVRFLNIDTLETYHSIKNDLDQNQMDHGKRAGDHLRTMLSDGDEVILRIGEEPLDGYGRLLAEVITLDGVNTNYEMVKAGQAVTYFIWPFENDVVHMYAEALRQARLNELGIWNPEDPMLEYPFEFRARERGSVPSRPVGDIRTKFVVPGDQWATILPEYRVFFNNLSDAEQAGFKAKPNSLEEVLATFKTELTTLFEGNVIKRSTFNLISNQMKTVENRLDRVANAEHSRSLVAHENNLIFAIAKLENDVIREFNIGNLPTNSYQTLLAFVELLQEGHGLGTFKKAN
jgi:endonuclease YncB( thermonuclease family)